MYVADKLENEHAFQSEWCEEWVLLLGKERLSLPMAAEEWVRWFVLQAENCLRCWVLVVCHQNPDVLVSDDR